MKRIPIAMLAIAGASAMLIARRRKYANPPRTVGKVDLTKYAGTWFEQARYPNFFQDRVNRFAVAVTATYQPQPDGTISVHNHCRDAANGGRVISVHGYARAASHDNDKLRVTFFWPFFGDYWILGLGPDYAWSVVGAPGRDFLWILSRNANLPESDYVAAIEVARREGFNIDRLRKTPTSIGDELLSDSALAAI